MTEQMKGTKSPMNTGAFKRVFSVLVVLLLASVLMVGAVSADTTPKWGEGEYLNSTWYDYENVNGATTYHIYNNASLAAFAQKVNGGEKFTGKTVKLMNDIDLSNIEWTPIGTGGSQTFCGTFDGDNKTISNLNFTNYEGTAGLFGIAGWGDVGYPNIKNLKLHNVDISSTDSIGAFAGYLVGTITNCHVSGDINIQGKNVGGLVGYAYATVTDCTVKGNEGSVVTGIYQEDNIGGLLGKLPEGNNKVENCSVVIDVTGTTRVGGLIGVVEYGTDTISDSSSEGTVTLAYMTEYSSTLDDNVGNAGSLIGAIWVNDESNIQVTASSSTSSINVEDGFTEEQVSVGFIGATYVQVKGVDEKYYNIYNGESDLGKITFTSDSWTPTLENYNALKSKGYLKLELPVTVMPESSDENVKPEITVTGTFWAMASNTSAQPLYAELSYGSAVFNWEITEGTDVIELVATTGDAVTYKVKVAGTAKITVSAGEDITEVVTITVYPEAEPDMPIEEVETSVDETTGNTTAIITEKTTGTGTIDVDTSKNEVTITDENGIEMKIEGEKAEEDTTNNKVKVTNITKVTVTYPVNDTVPSTDESEAMDGISYKLELSLENVTEELPAISPEFKGDIAKQVTDEFTDVTPLSMISASIENDAAKLGAFNKNISDDGITLTFTIPKTGKYATTLHVNAFHVNGTNVNEVPVKVKEETTQWVIIVTGQEFSSYVIAEVPAPVVKDTSSSSSSSSGSSVWLTETPTETPTPTQTPTAQPTDAVPTDIPVTQPTETPASPAFGALAALAGLGAVAVLRRK